MVKHGRGLYASTPLRLCASTPLRLVYAWSMRLCVHVYSTVDMGGVRMGGVQRPWVHVCSTV
jgi:hypothetical protein